jgi:hypothetical protein
MRRQRFSLNHNADISLTHDSRNSDIIPRDIIIRNIRQMFKKIRRGVYEEIIF